MKMGASSAADSLRKRAGIASGPAALDGLRPRRSFSTPVDEMTMSGIVGWGEMPRWGKSCSFSSVKTDENCSLSFDAFSLLVEAISRPDFSVLTPKLSSAVISQTGRISSHWDLPLV